MKKLFVIAIIATACALGFPNYLGGLLGIGKGAYGIADRDPLGTPVKLHALFTHSGFEGDFGSENVPRTITYSYTLTPKHDVGGGAIQVVIGADEYIQKITGVFWGTQHGYSQQRMSTTESLMRDLWSKTGGPNKLKFDEEKIKVLTVPATLKFPRAIDINEKQYTAKFSTEYVNGTYAYEEHAQFEIIQLALK